MGHNAARRLVLRDDDAPVEFTLPTIPAPGVDSDLLRRLVARDDAAWLWFYKKYTSRLQGTLQGIGPQWVDVAHEVFVRVNKSIDTFDPTLGGFDPWFFTIAVRARASYWRSYLRRRLDSLDAAGAILDNTDVGLQLAIRMDLAPALEQLTQKERQVFDLRFVDGMSYDEIAAQIGGSADAAKMAASRAAKHLRALLPDYGPHS